MKLFNQKNLTSADWDKENVWKSSIIIISSTDEVRIDIQKFIRITSIKYEDI